jgi:nitrogen regulatory protein P-II 1
MKELTIIIPHTKEKLDAINSILYKYKVGGIVVFEIEGRGRAERQEIEQRTVEGYPAGKSFVPDFHKRIMVQTAVKDGMEKDIISEILDTTSTGTAGDGKIIVKDIAGAYDIGSKEAGEKAVL